MEIAWGNTANLPTGRQASAFIFVGLRKFLGGHKGLLCATEREYKLTLQKTGHLLSILTGPLDHVTAEGYMRDHLLFFINHRPLPATIVIDLSDCSVIDTEGAAVLAALGHHTPSLGIQQRTIVVPRCSFPRHALTRLRQFYWLDDYYQFAQPFPFSLN